MNKYHTVVKDYDSEGANNTNLITFILYLLSYHLIFKEKTHSTKYFLSDTNNYVKTFNDIINDVNTFKTEYKKFIKNRFHGKKRVWCCVRDYLKSPEFRDYFLNALSNVKDNIRLMKIWKDKRSVLGLELPGDTWNMNSVFVNKLVKNNINIKSDKFCKELRENLSPPYYPELLDFSFDFVPRMCSNSSNVINKSMCKICIFGKKGMMELCHQDSKKLCPITMIICGYIHKCEPEGCPIKSGVGIRLCKEL